MVHQPHWRLSCRAVSALKAAAADLMKWKQVNSISIETASAVAEGEQGGITMCAAVSQKRGFHRPHHRRLRAAVMTCKPALDQSDGADASILRLPLTC